MNIVLIGHGKRGSDFRWALESNHSVTVVDPNPVVPCPHVTSLNDIRESPTHVIIATPAHHHVADILVCLDRFSAVPILCEKPISHVMPAQDISDRLRDAGRVRVCAPWRLHPVLGHIPRDCPIVRLAYRNGAGWPDDDPRVRDWNTETAVHLVDWMLWRFGSLDHAAAHVTFRHGRMIAATIGIQSFEPCHLTIEIDTVSRFRFAEVEAITAEGKRLRYWLGPGNYLLHLMLKNWLDGSPLGTASTHEALDALRICEEMMRGHEVRSVA